MTKVLIVDDELPIREWIKMIISNLDMNFEKVTAVSSAEEAWKAFLEHNHDVVITDIKMGQLSGIELLKKIRVKSKKSYIVMLTSHNDFAFARDALKYGANEFILKTEVSKESITTIFNNYHSEIHDTGSRNRCFIDEIIQQFLTNEIDKELFETNNLLDEPCKNYFALATPLNESEGVDSDIGVGVSERLSIIGHYFIKENIQFILIEGHHASSEAMQYNEIYIFAQNIMNIYGVSVGFSGINHSKVKAMINAQKGLNMSFYKENREICMFTEEKNLNIDAVKTFRTSALKYIYGEESEKALGTIKSMCQYAKEESYHDVQGFKSYVIDVIHAYKLSHIDYIGNDFTKETETCIQKLKESKKISEFVNIIEAYMNVNKSSTDPLYDNYSAYTKKAIKYVEDYYYKNISLVDVVAEININQEYFCRVFKGETGKTFINYLTDYKIEKAKRLLTNTDLPIKEISEKLGYGSLSYFSRVFKKKTGSNPFQFRH